MGDSLLQQKFGLMEWLPFDPQHGGEHRLERVIGAMHDLGITDLRTGISLAEIEMEGGREWYHQMLGRLKEAGIRLFVTLCYMPDSLGMAEMTEDGPKVAPNSPPKDVEAAKTLIRAVLDEYSPYFTSGYVELWNEANDETEWNHRLDPEYERFLDLIMDAAGYAKKLGLRVALSGVRQVDAGWYDRMFQKAGRRLTDVVDIISYHCFKGTWPDNDGTWAEMTEQLAAVTRKHNAGHIAVWITEAGYSTFRSDDPDREQKQVDFYRDLRTAPVPMVFWFSVLDAAEHRPTVREATTGSREPEMARFGIMSGDGRQKRLYSVLKQEAQEKGPELVTDYDENHSESSR